MDIDESRKGENPFDEPTGKLRRLDPAEVARRAGGRYEKTTGGGAVAVRVLSGEIRVLFPEIAIEATGEVDSFTLKLLTLLYLAGSDGTPPSGEWIAYRELPGGRFYEPVLKRSVADPLAERFAEDANGFREACEAAGGGLETFGDASGSFALFPSVRICFIFWRSDEEFSARVQVLFDSNSSHHLSAFDLRMGSQDIASRLLKWKKGDGA